MTAGYCDVADELILGGISWGGGLYLFWGIMLVRQCV